MQYPNFNEEKKLWKKGFRFVTGLDEAGRGPLAGPVVAAAVCIINPKHKTLNSKQAQNSNFKNSKCVLDFGNSDLGFWISGVRDSKQLSEKKREEFYKIITDHPEITWGIGIVSEKIIDKINILEATKLAMKKAVNDLSLTYQKISDRGFSDMLNEVDFLLIDGNFKINSKVPQKSVIKGDQRVFSISAASIIAKVTRDQIMQKMHKKYPQYGFDAHKGYGTSLHIKNLKNFGPCKIHRKTFWPVSDIARNEKI